MVKSAEFSLKRRIGNKGFVASISLNANLKDGEDCDVIFHETVDKEWHNSIKFAASYFYESFFSDSHKRLLIEVTNLSTLIVDTRQLIVFYVMINCLCECYSKTSPIELNENNGKFILNG